MVASFSSIPGYSCSELLYEGLRTLVYRGHRKSDRLSVAIKLLKNPYPSFTELVQFRNQYTIAKNLDIPGVIRPYCLETYHNGYALVMEDFGSISLREYIHTYSFDVWQFLHVALQLTNILDGLYRQKVIHKDIKPANILIHPESLQVKLIDFSISSLLPRETQEIHHPNVLEGTLAYLSPEQTGRMNRLIDYRTDFYSVGVTFYELLTRRLPFEVDEPMELVHCHIAQYPLLVNEINSEIPPVLSQIVEKLMAKNAEDRYQSALGLKYDLEQCLAQLQQTGKIELWEIGQRDICDRFSIPEKLYGRQAEVETLLAAFERVSVGATELILIAGFSGIGKTAVVNEIHKPIVRQRGYFIKGKFEQLGRNIPLSAFVQAFRDLIGQLLTQSDYQLSQWKTKILDALGENAQVIIEVIPELESIIGQQPSVLELSGNAAQNRFNLLFQKFIQVFATIEHPLVIFVDDLQWADLASLNLMQFLLSESSTSYLLIIGAYRDNEVETFHDTSLHPLQLTLNELQKNQIIFNKITLSPLNETHLNQLIADTLSCTTEIALPLTQLVYQKTQGNPFFSNQFLKALYDDGLITFNPTSLIKGEQRGVGWQCDIAQVKVQALTDDVVEFMALQLQKLPDSTQNVLKLAACIGNQFDLVTLAVVCEESPTETAASLWKALEEGLILPTSEVYKFYQEDGGQWGIGVINNAQCPNYKFLHDRVQQAAYSLILSEHKPAVHLKIGRLLLKAATNPDDSIFEIVGHLNRGINLIFQPQEREQLAQLNLLSGQKAKAAIAYTSALEYLQIAVSLLKPNAWQSQYILTLNIYEELVNLAYLNGKFEQMEMFSSIVLQQAKTLLDRIKVYELKIQAYAIGQNFAQAIQVAREVLQLLEINLPHTLTPKDNHQAIQEITSIFHSKNLVELTNLPVMTQPEKLAAVRILSSVATSVYLGQQDLYPFIVLQQIKLSFDYGFAPISAYAYSCYGLIMIGCTSDYNTGYIAANLALNLLEKFPTKEFTAKVITIAYVSSKCWKQHIRDGMKPLLHGYQVGRETGDLEFAAYCVFHYGATSYLCGLELNNLYKEMKLYYDASRELKQQTSLNYQQLYLQAVIHLLGKEYNRDVNEVNQEAIHSLFLKANDQFGLCILYTLKLIEAYTFANFALALRYAQEVEKYPDGMSGYYLLAIFNFYSSLTYLANAQKDTSLLHVKANQEQMRIWANHAPMNFLHKFYLVEAEKHRLLGQRAEAIELYDRAITLAKENEYINEQALANELAARFYLEWGKEKIAQVYIIEAYYCYARWSAKAKTSELEKRYPQLLQPILQQQVLAFNSLETISTQTTHTSTSTNVELSEALDFATILKASQALSGEIYLDKLLISLLNVAIVNAGASKCVLMLLWDNNLRVEAVAQLGQEPIVLQALPVDDSLDVPVNLVYSVKRSWQPVVINDARKEVMVTDYIIQNQPKSLLCIPIINQGKLLGILYLENNLTTGAFTKERVEVLNLLCTQAAISLENAKLYQKTHSYAQQLEQSLQNLQQAQTQLVQSEKMSSLGNLVAGVAHEVNNPIAFLKGSLNNVEDYIKDLLGYIQYVEQHHPQLASAVTDYANQIDLKFLTEDLPKLITSMKGATERIKDISTSLRTFSRADTSEKVAGNIHEGIDSTLLILKYRLKANEYRPAIEVVKAYGKLPLVKCFLGQLNQVFMNILANAIDAIDEESQKYSFDELKANPKQITIQTEVLQSSHTAVIKIKDNGPGMSQAVLAKIFNHLFTTKSVGKGTGLGLAIARQIVEETHGGKLSCHSILTQGTEFTIHLPLL